MSVDYAPGHGGLLCWAPQQHVTLRSLQFSSLDLQCTLLSNSLLCLLCWFQIPRCLITECPWALVHLLSRGSQPGSWRDTIQTPTTPKVCLQPRPAFLTPLPRYLSHSISHLTCPNGALLQLLVLQPVLPHLSEGPSILPCLSSSLLYP